MFRPAKKPAAPPRPENELVLCCARRNVDPSRADRIRHLATQQLDWEYVLKTAFAHGVLPLLYKSLDAVCPEAMPPAILAQIREFFQAHVQRNLLLTAELLRVLRVLSDHGITALPYKGPVLAAAVYGDVSLRSFSDLDILVDKGDILRAKDLILSQGYELRTPLTRKQEAAHLRSKNGKDFAFVGLQGSVRLELHWELANLTLFPFETKHLWSRLETTSVCGTKVLNLPPEDLLLILCVHGAKHFFQRLEWICDIAELLASRPEMDWEAVFNSATRLRCTRMLLFGLLLARDLIGADLPDRVSASIQADSVAGLLAKRVQTSIFDAIDSSSQVVRKNIHVIGLREHRLDRGRLCLQYVIFYVRSLLTPNTVDKELFRLPSSLSFAYYLLRPVRLLKVYGLNLLPNSVERRKP